MKALTIIMDYNKHETKNRRNITAMDVANEAGVSLATVSRVLNGYEFVKDSTRTRVVEAMEKLGYVANWQARSLASGSSRLIGLLVPNLDMGYVGTIVQAIDRELERNNYDLILYTSHRRPDKETFYVSSVANGMTEGLLLVAPQGPANYLNTLRKQNYPYILIDQVDSKENGSYVEASNWQGAYDATTYLLELGHTRIAFIKGELSVQSALDRLEGYRDALKEYDVPIQDDLIISGDYQQQTSYESTKRLLQTIDSLPTAIFASNDLSAFGAMDAARECGLFIPDDISIIGFDDIPQADLVYPKLTTVRQPLDEMGQVAVKLLLERIEHPEHPPQSMRLPTQFIIRDSCVACKNQEGSV